jgi:ribonuclease-3
MNSTLDDSERPSVSPTLSDSSSEDELPYNEKNIIITKEELSILLNKFGITMSICDINIYRTSFVHKSYCTRKNDNFIDGNLNCLNNCVPLQESSNERLEFTGDAILSDIVANYLYERYPFENEGFLTKMRTKIVNGTMLSFLSKEIGLGKYILISKQIENSDGRNNKNILEDVFESFLGALYRDFNNKNINSKKIENLVGLGHQICQKFVVNVIERYIDFSELVNNNKNYKDTLIKYFQHNFQSQLKFQEINVEKYNNNKKIFVVSIKNPQDLVLGIGKGESKKLAEQNASYEALKYLGQIHE